MDALYEMFYTYDIQHFVGVVYKSRKCRQEKDGSVFHKSPIIGQNITLNGILMEVRKEIV